MPMSPTTALRIDALTAWLADNPSAPIIRDVIEAEVRRLRTPPSATPELRVLGAVALAMAEAKTLVCALEHKLDRTWPDLLEASERAKALEDLLAAIDHAIARTPPGASVVTVPSSLWDAVVEHRKALEPKTPDQER